MSDRFSAEALIRAAASGAIPAPGDVLLRVEIGWIFSRLDASLLEGEIDPDQIDTLPFTKITGVILAGQVPLGVVKQHEAALEIAFTQLIGQIADAQVPASAVNQYIQQKEVELDWGSDLYQTSKTFVVPDTDVGLGDQISMFHSLTTPTGKDLDESELDTFICRCVAGVEEFTVYMDSLFGSVVGPFVYNYIRG
jgi:hypothetical protein